MADKPKQTKIVLLTGYLGAGKTTLLNHILSNDRGVRAAVLVNDIGEINVDASLIAKGGLSQVDGELIPSNAGEFRARAVPSCLDLIVDEFSNLSS